MPAKTPSKNSKVKTISPAGKPVQKADGAKIRALEEQLAQREGEISRLSNENQRLVRENEQRATELQIINNIGQTLTEGLDLNSTLERVGERLREVLKVEHIGITAVDPKTGIIVAQYLHSTKFTIDQFSPSKFKSMMRISARGGGKSWVLNTNAEKSWRFAYDIHEGNEIPKSFVGLPLLAGKEMIGGILFGDYEKENAFTNISIGMLETIASNLGTAIQNVRLFDETQRLLKETEQRATELQIINNIGQTLTEGLDLNSMIERVAERLHEVLKVDNIGITIINPNTGQVISQNNIFHSTDPSFATDRFSLDKFKSLMRLSARGGNRSWVMNTNAEKSWRKYAGNLLEGDRTPKSFVALPLLVGKNANGGIIFADYEKENAFIDLPIRMLETIAYNMGTGIQNVLLFDETQRLLNETEQRNTELTMLSIVQQALSSHLDFKAIYEAVGRKLIEIFRVQAASIYTIDLESRIITYEYAFEPTSERELGQRPATGLHNYVIDQIIASRKSFVLNSGFDELVSSFTDSGASRRIKPKSLCVTPILFQKNTLMAVSLHNIETENFFDNSAVRLLETISNATGVALENARLFEETQRLLDETEQRATELQIINNIGQTLTEGGDLESMIQRVGERIQEALNVNNIIISIFDKETERIIANYMVRNGEQTTLSKEDFNMHAIKILMRASARRGGISWVIKDDEVEKFWHRWRGSIGDDVPKSVVVLPLLAGREVIGGITLADYEKENAFTDLSLNLLETIASNMGTAVQNVRLFDETQHLFKEAEESRATAERANKAKSTFLANMSHELRTPLNAIMGFTSIVRDKSQGVLPEKQINNLEKVLASSQHLLGLINTVLDLAKIEAGRMDVIPAKFNINVLIDLCGNLAAPLLKPNVPLVKQVDETIGIVYSDQDKIKQILLNLLSNAAKFTHEGRVLLSVEKPDPETVNISVTDSGIGIKADAIDRVFEEFQQADATTTRQYGGTGLGLPISRSLARLLGGDLTATSELGKGSTFTLTIPTKYGGIPAASANPTPGAVQPAESLTQAGSSHP